MRKKLLLAIFLLSSVTISGCWDLREPDRLNFVTTIGIDRETNGKILLTVQIPLPQNLLSPRAGTGGNANKQFSLASFTGFSVNSAFIRMTAKDSKELVLFQNKSVIIGMGAAQSDIRAIIDYLRRSPQVPPQATIMIADGVTAAEILKMRLVTENLPGIELVQTAQNVDKYNWTYFIPIWEFEQKLIHESKDAFASLITLDKEEKRYIQSGLAVFNGDKLAGKLSSTEAQSFGVLANLMKSGHMDFELALGEKVTLRNVKAKTKVRVKGDSQKPEFLIHTKLQASLSEWTSVRTMVKQDDIEYLQRTIGHMIQEDLQSVIKKLQVLNSDVIGLGEQVRVQRHDLWRKINWKETFPKVPFQLKVDIQIVSDGIFR
jgi:spore germination protein KC